MTEQVWETDIIKMVEWVFSKNLLPKEYQLEKKKKNTFYFILGYSQLTML